MPGEADITDIGLFRRLDEGAPPAAAAPTRRRLPELAIPLAMMAADMLAWGAVALGQDGTVPGDTMPVAGPMLLFLLLGIGFLARDGLYRVGVPLAVGPHAMAATRALGGALGICGVAVWLLRDAAGLSDIARNVVLAGLAMLAGRVTVCLAARVLPPDRLAPRAVLVGDDGAATSLMAGWRDDPAEPCILGLVDAGMANSVAPDLPRLGDLGHLEELARGGLVDQVILSMADMPGPDMQALIRRCAAWPVNIRLAQHWPIAGCARLGAWKLEHALDPPVAGWAGLVKRGEDVLLGAVLLAAFALPMAVLALAIRLDSPGPVLFRQRRMGFGNRHFEMFKFRTMHHAPASPHTTAEGCVQATRGDARVTRLGALLRRSSLDELPQLFNVLRGEMSLVGPRPHAPGTLANGRRFEEVVPFYDGRHRVKPGITGLAQVRGLRGETRTEAAVLARVDADFEYIARWSLGLDLLILLRTAMSVLTMRNAY